MESNSIERLAHFCTQLDTHAHTQLECPHFQVIRDNHPETIKHLQANPYMLYLPLPIQFEAMP